MTLPRHYQKKAAYSIAFLIELTEQVSLKVLLNLCSTIGPYCGVKVFYAMLPN